jgi:hypothetical protein
MSFYWSNTIHYEPLGYKIKCMMHTAYSTGPIMLYNATYVPVLCLLLFKTTAINFLCIIVNEM